MNTSPFIAHLYLVHLLNLFLWKLQAMEKTPRRHHRHGLANTSVLVMTFNNYWSLVLEVKNIILKFKMYKLICMSLVIFPRGRSRTSFCGRCRRQRSRRWCPSSRAAALASESSNLASASTRGNTRRTRCGRCRQGSSSCLQTSCMTSAEAQTVGCKQAVWRQQRHRLQAANKLYDVSRGTDYRQQTSCMMSAEAQTAGCKQAVWRQQRHSLQAANKLYDVSRGTDCRLQTSYIWRQQRHRLQAANMLYDVSRGTDCRLQTS